MIDALQIALGLLLLLLGGRVLVWSSVRLAERLAVSPLVIGITVVAVGTSAPEILVNLIAALRDVPALGVGNILGANIANVLLVLGAASLVSPIAHHPAVLRRDGPVMLLAVLALAGAAAHGAVPRWLGGAMLTALVVYFFAIYRLERGSAAARAERRAALAEEMPAAPAGLPATLGGLAGAIAALVAGSHLVVEGGVGAARAMAVSEAVIGATIVAAGTVLPELTASLAAAFKRHADLAVGNVIGSIVVNTLGAIGLAALVKPFAVPGELLRFDVPFMLAACLVLPAMGWLAGGIGRLAGALMATAYFAYAAALYAGVPARLAG